MERRGVAAICTLYIYNVQMNCKPGRRAGLLREFSLSAFIWLVTVPRKRSELLTTLLVPVRVLRKECLRRERKGCGHRRVTQRFRRSTNGKLLRRQRLVTATAFVRTRRYWRECEFLRDRLPRETPSDRSAMSLPSTHGARPQLEAVSLSSSSGMVNTFAAPLLRAQPVRSPVLPQSARAACSAFSPDVDADVCRWVDGLHS